MPTYVYQEIRPDGTEGETFEVDQPMADPPLATHPSTGNPVRKVYLPPNLTAKYGERTTKDKLSDENVEKHGFTRYEKDKVTGDYHKTAGRDQRAPEKLDTARLKQMRDSGQLG